jgi:uroporphyrinogen-III synthase
MMPLSGLTIAVTASRRASELAHLITAFGGKPYLAPTVGIDSINDTDGVTKFIDKVLDKNLDYIVFMSGPAVYTFMSAAERVSRVKRLIDTLKETVIVARSAKPQSVLAEYGLKTAHIPEDNTAKGVLNLFRKYDIEGKKIGIIWHGSYSQFLQEELHKANAEVFELSVYRYSSELNDEGAKILNEMGYKYIAPDEAVVVELIEDFGSGRIDAVTFTSPPSARELFTIAERHNLKQSLQLSLNTWVIVVAVGQSTRDTLEENDIKVDVMPKVYKMGSMIKSLSEYVSHNNHMAKQKRKPTIEGPSQSRS